MNNNKLQDRLSDLDSRIRINTLVNLGLTAVVFFVLIQKVKDQDDQIYRCASDGDMRRVKQIIDHPGSQDMFQKAWDEWASAHPEDARMFQRMSWSNVW